MTILLHQSYDGFNNNEDEHVRVKNDLIIWNIKMILKGSIFKITFYPHMPMYRSMRNVKQ